MKTSIWLPDADFERFEHVAARHGMSRSEFYRVAARRLADELEREAEFAARASAVIESLAVDAWEAPLLQEQQRVFLEGSTW